VDYKVFDQRMMPLMMIKKLSDYSYASLMFISAVLLLVGLFRLWHAVSFEQYIGALLLIAIAVACCLAALELKPMHAKAFLAALAKPFRRSNPDEEARTLGPAGE